MADQVLLKDSIATQLLKIIFGCYLVVTTLVTTAQMVFEYQHVSDKISQEIQILPNTFGPGLGSALWTYNDALLQSILMGMHKIPSVSGVTIDDGINVKRIGLMAEDGNSLLPQLISHEFPISYTDNKGRKKQLGTGTIYSSTDVVIERVKYGFLLILVNSIIKTLALWVIFLFFVRRMLGRPLRSLTLAIEQLNLDNLEQAHIPVSTRGRNELTVLENAFNFMIQKLIVAREKLQQLNQTVTEHRDHLEDMVTERTATLKSLLTERKKTQAQLIQSAKLASLGQMATGVAHELNQPLMIISMNAEMTLEEVEAGNYAEIMEAYTIIREQAQRAAKIVKHLKIFGRDTSKDHYRKTDLHVIIQNALGLMSEQLRLHNIAVVQELCEPSPQVQGNAIQLEQVLTNLLTNAQDALNADDSKEAPPKKITIRSYQQEEQGIIEVKDTGPGMTDDVVDQIFDPFFTTKDVGQGTGLGLSISHSLIQEHEGQLDVESNVGRGTLFRIRLPLLL